MRALVAVVLLLTLGVVAAPAGSDAAGPDSKTQPPRDGCARDPGAIIAGTTPSWVYVDGDATPRHVVGVARQARPTFIDLYRTHDSYDMNVFLVPDPGFEHLLGTANHGDSDFPEQRGVLEIEWEERAFPRFAWPTAGDRVEVVGSWVWDCAHWGPTNPTDPAYLAPGTQPGENVTGEHTEIHPPRFVATHRVNPVLDAAGAAVTDVVVSSRGTLARAHAEWAIGSCSEADVTACPQRTPVEDRDYWVNVTAPPRPPNATRIVWRVIDRGSLNAPDPEVAPTATGITVRLPFAGRDAPAESVFAKRFLVAWDTAPSVHHYRVHVTRVEWFAELDGPAPFTCVPLQPCSGAAQESTPPDEVNVYVEVGGTWTALTHPRLATMAPGVSLDVDHAFDVFVPATAPADASWRVFAQARECDQPEMLECAAPEEVGFNENAGAFTVRFNVTDDPTGTHVGLGSSSHCEAAAGGPCFALTFVVTDAGVVTERGSTGTPWPGVAPPSGAAPVADRRSIAAPAAAAAVAMVVLAASAVTRRLR